MADNGYIKSLDGLRAIAVLLVMSFHAEITHFGWLGVQLFFVLSGFLITGILWKEKSREGPVSYKFKKFWVRRTLRIFPLYFGYLLVLGLTYLFFHFPSYYVTYIPYLLTYTFNFTRTLQQWHGNPLFTHLWSLSIEEQFYLFFPLIVLLWHPRYIRRLMLAVIALSPLIRLALGQYYAARGLDPELLADTLYWNTASHIDAFFLGGLIPVFALHQRIKTPRTVFYICLALALLAGGLNFYSSASGNSWISDLGYNHGQTAHLAYVWEYTCLNLFFASFILVLVSDHTRRSPSRLRSTLETGWMVQIGKVSYGMYIFHWLIMVYVINSFIKVETPLARIALFIPYVALVYLVSLLSFKLYESPFVRLKDRLFPTGPASKTTSKKISETPIS
ncbi:MAG: acyltransferase [Chitinophagaceae bacterium]|nr:acyltransferase [Chitinophagaceae bacterium]